MIIDDLDTPGPMALLLIFHTYRHMDNAALGALSDEEILRSPNVGRESLADFRTLVAQGVDAANYRWELAGLRRLTDDEKEKQEMVRLARSARELLVGWHPDLS